MPAEVIVMPDAAAVVIDWLEPQLAAHGYTVRVTSRISKPRPSTFVTVRRGGGVLQTLVSDAATLLIECWAGTEEAAMDLAQVTRALVHAMQSSTQGGVPVYRVQEFAGPALLPDPVSDQPRVVMTMQVQMRGYAA